MKNLTEHRKKQKLDPDRNINNRWVGTFCSLLILPKQEYTSYSVKVLLILFFFTVIYLFL